MLDFVACLPPSGGDGSEKCEYLIDRFMAEVESSYILIGAFEFYNVFRSKARSIPCEMRKSSGTLLQRRMKPCDFLMYTNTS